MKSEDALEGRLNGDKDTLDEMDESRKEDRNGFKARFMFNIADGGFTGKNEADFAQSTIITSLVFEGSLEYFINRET